MDNEQQEENNNNPVGSLIAHGVMSGVGVEKDDQEGNEESFPLPTTNEVLQCQISSWYEKFSSIVGHPRKNVTIKSIIIDKLPIDFREYLLSDGVRLPVDATNLSSFAPPESADDNDEWSSDEDENNNADNNEQESECTEPPKQFHFPDLNERIITAIEALKGSVIPKLNWSTPKDAVWVNGGSLKCTTAGDIYLLVKSSDFCLHDVQMHALEDCAHDDSDVNDKSKDQTTAAIEIQPHPELQLTLRKWCNLYPSMEFRCFIRHHEIGKLSFSFSFSFRSCLAKKNYVVASTKKENILSFVFFQKRNKTNEKTNQASHLTSQSLFYFEF